MFDLLIKTPSRPLPVLRRFKKRVRPNMMVALTRIAIKAEQQVKQVDLTRGGGFRITKTSTGSGRNRGPATPKWIKNTSKYPRIGDGTLRSSWRHQKAKRVGSRIASRIRSGSVYARIIELGGHAGRGGKVYLKGWPYIGPMMKRNRNRFLKIAGRAIFQGFKGS